MPVLNCDDDGQCDAATAPAKLRCSRGLTAAREQVISGFSLRNARNRFATRAPNMLSSSPSVLTLNSRHTLRRTVRGRVPDEDHHRHRLPPLTLTSRVHGRAYQRLGQRLRTVTSQQRPRMPAASSGCGEGLRQTLA